MTTVNAWGSDVKPSMPSPLTRPALVDLGGSGFCFTAAGIAHYVTEADLEDYQSPTFAPLLHQGR